MDLIVGDLHVQNSNLKDTKNLLDGICNIYLDNGCNRIIFLGDIFHTHAVIRQEVGHFIVDYWKNVLWKIVNYDRSKIICIPGNHDAIAPTDSSKNALGLLLSEYCTVVPAESNNIGMVLKDSGYVFLPFLYDNNLFVELANKMYDAVTSSGIRNPVLFCHQTFDGAAYETGMPCENGIDSNQLFYDLIISGHIHTPQVINEKVFYVGTPRQVTSAEANQKKYIYLLNRQIDGEIKIYPIDVSNLTKNYWKMELTQDENYSLNKESYMYFVLQQVMQFFKNCKPEDDRLIRICGTKEYCLEVSKRIKELNLNIKFSFKYIQEETDKMHIDMDILTLDRAIVYYLENILKIESKEERVEILKELRELGL